MNMKKCESKDLKKGRGVRQIRLLDTRNEENNKKSQLSSFRGQKVVSKNRVYGRVCLGMQKL